MKCRYCGMESRTPQVCEWCHKPLTAGTQTTPGPPAPTPGGVPLPPPPSGAPPLAPSLNAPYTPPPLPATGSYPAAVPYSVPVQDLTQPISPPPMLSPAPRANQRVSLTGDVIDIAAAQEQTLIGSVLPGSMPVAGLPPPGATVMGAPPPMQTPYGLPVAAITPQLLNDQHRSLRQVRTWGESFELFLALALPVLLASLILVHAVPPTLWWVSLGDTVLLSLIMGATGAIPSFDDAYTDVAIVLVLTFLLGPLIALIIYLIVAALKQECNGAVVGLLVLNLLISYVLMIAVMTSGTFSLQSLLMLSIMSSLVMGVLRLVNVFFAFGAWMVSGFFRPFEAT